MNVTRLAPLCLPTTHPLDLGVKRGWEEDALKEPDGGKAPRPRLALSSSAND